MSIQVKGRIILDNFKCSHCSNSISSTMIETVRCGDCRAVFKREEVNIDEASVEVSYTFTDFGCLNTGCDEICPSPYMYCKTHSSEEEIEKHRKSLQYAKDRLDKELSKLDVMERSRKTWLIMELGGVEDEV